MYIKNNIFNAAFLKFNERFSIMSSLDLIGLKKSLNFKMYKWRRINKIHNNFCAIFKQYLKQTTFLLYVLNSSSFMTKLTSRNLSIRKRRRERDQGRHFVFTQKILFFACTSIIPFLSPILPCWLTVGPLRRIKINFNDVTNQILGTIFYPMISMKCIHPSTNLLINIE